VTSGWRFAATKSSFWQQDNDVSWEIDMSSLRRAAILFLATSFVFGFASQSSSQTGPEAVPTKEQLARDNNLFISLAKKVLKWEEPADPVHIVGPIYFVGTKGLGAFLFTTS
jgi:metallo-beta-lactamase class B